MPFMLAAVMPFRVEGAQSITPAGRSFVVSITPGRVIGVTLARVLPKGAGGAGAKEPRRLHVSTLKNVHFRFWASGELTIKSENKLENAETGRRFRKLMRSTSPRRPDVLHAGGMIFPGKGAAHHPGGMIGGQGCAVGMIFPG